MGYKSFPVEELIKITDLYSVFQEDFEQGYKFTGEMHNFWECVYVVRGRVCVSADSRVCKLKAGEIIFHKPLEMHKFFIEDAEGANLFIFSFSMESAISHKMADKIFALNSYQKNILHILMAYLKDECNNNQLDDMNCYQKGLVLLNNSPQAIQMIASHITHFLISISENEGLKSDSPDNDALLFKKAVDLLNEHITSSITVNQLANKLNVSVSGIKRLFEKYAGISIHKYYLMLKMKVATSMLQSGLRVNEVSDKLGFCSQAYFSSAYKREMKINPSMIEKNL